MKIQGKVVEVERDVEIEKKDGGTYTGTTLVHKDTKGKVETKAWAQKSLDHRANAHIKIALGTLVPGTLFEAESTKNDAGFWNWITIKIVDSFSSEPEKQNAPTAQRSTWQGETPEERAERRSLDKQKFEFEKEKQKLIIRQSCLSNAINFMNKREGIPTVNDVLTASKQFEHYVLSGDNGSLEDLENDLPF